jgi:hypothetical protein
MDIDVKRFYIPGFTLQSKCPECNKEVIVDLASDYLSYPKANEPDNYDFYCGDCEAEWTKQILLTIKVEML